MNKNKVLGLALGAAITLLPLLASAASISDARFSNSQTNIDATGGATVSGTFTLSVGPGEVVEWFRLLPAGNPFTEMSVGGSLGYQEGVYTNVPFSVKVPPNTGTYNVDVQGAGIWGGNRAINGNDNVVVGPTSVGSVRVVASGSSSSDPGPVIGSEDFWTKLAALIAGIVKTQHPAYCASIVAYNGMNASAAQASLFASPQAVFFTSKGIYAPTGYWGSISMSAASAATAACN